MESSETEECEHHLEYRKKCSKRSNSKYISKSKSNSEDIFNPIKYTQKLQLQISHLEQQLETLKIVKESQRKVSDELLKNPHHRIIFCPSNIIYRIFHYLDRADALSFAKSHFLIKRIYKYYEMDRKYLDINPIYRHIKDPGGFWRSKKVVHSTFQLRSGTYCIGNLQEYIKKDIYEMCKSKFGRDDAMFKINYGSYRGCFVPHYLVYDPIFYDIDGRNYKPNTRSIGIISKSLWISKDLSTNQNVYILKSALPIQVTLDDAYICIDWIEKSTNKKICMKIDEDGRDASSSDHDEDDYDYNDYENDWSNSEEDSMDYPIYDNSDSE